MLTALKDAITRSTVSELKDLLTYIPLTHTEGLKGELVERITVAMLGESLEAIWASLDDLQRNAVAEAVYHPQGEYSSQRVQAKYAKAPAFVTDKGKSHGYGQKSTAFALFIHYDSDSKDYFVPRDLQHRLLTFVPRPLPVQLPSADVLEHFDDLVTRLTEREALQDLPVLLRTLEHSRISVSDKTAMPSAVAVRLIGEHLTGGDFYPVVEKVDKWDQQLGPIKALAWPLLLQAGGLAAPVGGRLSLSPAGLKALSKPPAQVLRGLWQKWLKTTILDEFSRIDLIKGQNSKGRVMSALAPRRAAIHAALTECPAGRWVGVDDFSTYMRAASHDFVVAHDPWPLYLFDRDHGSLGYDGSNGWNILQDRYIFALLFEYAATLGIIDVAYFDPKDYREEDYSDMWGADDLDYLSRYDGLSHFRITPLGAYVLGLTETYQPVLQASTVKLLVMPNLQVNVVGGTLSMDDSLLLANWAIPIESHCWQLDSPKTMASLEKGHDIAALKHFLESHDELPLPETVAAFLKNSERNGKALKLGANANLIECRDSATAENIATHKETRALCLRAGDKTLVVRADHLPKFRERVRVLGLGMVG